MAGIIAILKYNTINKAKKSKMKLSLFCGLLMLSVSCVNKTEKDSEKDLLKPSYKEQKKTENYSEYFDTISNIYSNYKYNIAIRAPKNWKRDRGISEHTIFRTFQKDSGFSLSVNVIEPKYNIGNSYWIEYKKNKISSEKKIKEIIEKQINSSINNVSTKVTFLKNFKSLKRKYDYTMVDGDYKIDMTSISYQVPKDNFIYTITFTVPNIFYEKKPSYYDNILTDVYWLSNKKFIKNEIYNK